MAQLVKLPTGQATSETALLSGHTSKDWPATQLKCCSCNSFCAIFIGKNNVRRCLIFNNHACGRGCPLDLHTSVAAHSNMCCKTTTARQSSLHQPRVTVCASQTLPLARLVFHSHIIQVGCSPFRQAQACISQLSSPGLHISTIRTQSGSHCRCIRVRRRVW